MPEILLSSNEAINQPAKLNQIWAITLGRSFANHIQKCEWLATGEVDNSAQQVGALATPAVADYFAMSKSFEATSRLYGAKVKKTDPTLLEVLKLAASTFESRSVHDSSLGGNEAINPMWGFNRDDDIVHPIGMVTDKTGAESEIGMGRVYSDMYDRNQQVLHLMFGKANYIGIAKFLKDSGNSKLSAIMRGEDSASLGKLIGAMLDSAGKTLLKLPFAPINLFFSLWREGNIYNVSKFVNFSPSMTSYYRVVNTMMNTVAAGMGLGTDVGWDDGRVTGGAHEDALQKLYDQIGRPEVIKHGLDIITILNKRHRRADPSIGYLRLEDVQGEGKHGLVTKMQNVVAESQNTGDATFKDGLENMVMGGMQYVSFKIEKSDNATESISNSVGASDIANRMNAKSSQNMEKAFELTSLIKTGVATIDDAVSGIGEFAKGLVSHVSLGMADSSIEQMLGSGFYELPDMWKSSNFAKSYTFQISLRSRYGDPASIFQSVYVPLILLIAGALPRGVGRTMYTSPFVCRAYCKGQFAVPLGIIESMTISRGTSEFGWTYSNIPTAVDVSISIRDMSPVMFLGMAHSEDALMSIFRSNSSMTEYLTTLSGIGLKERLYFLPKMRARFANYLAGWNVTLLNPMYWATWLGERDTAQLVGEFSPFVSDWRVKTDLR